MVVQKVHFYLLVMFVLTWFPCQANAFTFFSPKSTEMKIVSVNGGNIEIRFISNDKTVKPSKVLGKQGQVNIQTRVYNQRNTRVSRQYSLDPMKPYLKHLQQYVVEDGTIRVPFEFDYLTATEPGYAFFITVDVTTQTSVTLSESVIIDLHKSSSLDVFSSPDEYHALLDHLKDMLLSPEQVEMLAENLKKAGELEICKLALAARIKPNWRMSKQHCSVGEGATSRDNDMAEGCVELSDRIFSDLLARATKQCEIDDIARRQVSDDVAEDLVNRFVSRWVTNSDFYQSTADLTNVLSWYDQFSPAQTADVKSAMEFEMNRVAIQKNSHRNFMDEVVISEAYRNLVVSELVVAAVTHNFRERVRLADVCKQQAPHLGEDKCFEFASDISQGLIKPFGFADLSEMHESAAYMRHQYESSLKGKIPAEMIESSLSNVRSWAQTYVSTQYEQSNCLNRSLFPLSFMIVRNRVPNIELIEKRNSEEYKYMVEMLSNNMEGAVQQLWSSLQRYPKLRDGRLSAAGCTDSAVLSSAFEPLLSNSR
ncbi:hypothetical Protein YC6258_03899 [Gynuella sunshinyii YC6258]|uniref:Uncharacterized protein n=2 Tax=Gynuella sunshinyii TaxID=1445505 RepID=A0A0C5V990_9GAMM|nr:hypothetical Protein YC6258_03899 [Gynuella sunshinyii YC6258]